MQFKKYFLFLIISMFFSVSAHSQGGYLTGDEVQRVKAFKQLLYGIDKGSVQRTIDDLEKTRYPLINLEIKEAMAKTYVDLVGEYNVTGQKKKEWLYSMICLNMAYLQFGGGQGNSSGTSSLNRLICQKLKGYLPPNALKQHGMVYSLD